MNASDPHFIGRKSQLQSIFQHIDRHSRSYLISIHGRGGIGKTWLMRRTRQQYREKAHCFDIVDFSQSKTRVVQWLMDEIARQATDGFDHYNEIRQKTIRQILGEPVISSNQQADREVFLNDFVAWETQHERRCLFFFDTLELIQDTLILDFLKEMAERSRNTVFLLAGRRCDELTEKWRELLPPGFIVPVSLSGFEERDALEYIQARPAGNALTADEQRTLYLLSEGGVPLKLALALDWLSRGLVLPSLMHYSYVDLLDLQTRNEAAFRRILVDFERELVLLISELSTDADRVLSIMAHVHLRFNRELLRLLLPMIDAEKAIAELQAVPFLDYVKFIEPDYFVLHDEIQRMIVRHIWDRERDRTHDERRKISQEVINYYGQKLAELQRADRKSGEDVQWIYRIEKLHYELNVSLVQGYGQFVPLFEELMDRRENELAALALDIVLKDQPLPPELRRFAETYCSGWILVRQSRLLEARTWIGEHLQELETYQDMTQRNAQERAFLTREVLQRLGDVYTLLGYCNRLLGDWAEATRGYEKARDWTKQRLQKLQASEHQDPDQVRTEQGRLAEILNDIANIKRMQGQLEEARRHCKISLLIREQLGEARLIGHCCYVMSMILWESGNTAEAISYLSRARRNYQEAKLELLERAWVDRFEGYVMLRTGNLPRALTLLTRARDRIADEIGLQDEHAEVLLHLSRLHRMNDTPEAYEQAIQGAEYALAIAQRITSDFRISDSYLTLARTLWKQAHLPRPENIRRFQKGYGGENEKSLRLEQCMDEGESIAHRRGYRRLETLFADLRAEIAYDRSNYAEAFRLYTLACTLTLDLKPAAFARALSRLSEQLYRLVDEDPDQALTLCDQVMLLWSEDTERDDTHPEFRSEVFGYIRRIAQQVCQRRDLMRKMRVELDRGSWPAALQYCDELDRIPQHASTENARVLYSRALACHGANDFTLARLYGEQAARNWCKHSKCETELADTYLLLSRVYWQLGNSEWAADRIRQAERLSEAVDSDLGRCKAALEWGFVYFRTRQYDLAKENLQKAQSLARKLNEPLLLAEVLNVMSRVARQDPAYDKQPETGFQEAERRAREALQVLGDREWFKAAEIFLTLCLLHYSWGKYCAEIKRQTEAQEHFDQARHYHHQGWNKISEIASPMLHSIYRGVQGALLLEEGEMEKARFYFLYELIYATKTKHMRLMRAVDLLEQWLVALPSEVAREHAQWLLEQWRSRGYSRSYPQVDLALDWLIEFKDYIPERS